MKPLPFGMTKTPYGWPMMEEAFFNLVSFGLKDDDTRQQFFDDTKINLDIFDNVSPINRMVDDATGHTESVLGQFCDWVAVHLWGETE